MTQTTLQLAMGVCVDRVDTSTRSTDRQFELEPPGLLRHWHGRRSHWRARAAQHAQSNNNRITTIDNERMEQRRSKERAMAELREATSTELCMRASRALDPVTFVI